MRVMPHLVQMDKDYSKKGLQIIGAEVQGSTKESITQITKKFKVKFPITKGIRGPSTGSGIPRSVVFDTEGKVIFTGHPASANFESAIKKALRDVKDLDNGGGRKSTLPVVSKPLIDQRTWTNNEDKKITASVLSVEGDDVQFKLSSGKKVKYPIAKLSEEDQDLIKEAATKKESADSE
jgi:hypothetical protein